MKSIHKLFVFSLLLLPFLAHAQVEDVIIETYYVSSAQDSPDSFGNILDEGSVTYRIFVDLAEGNKLLALYGDEHHPLEISSSSYFYNNSFLGDRLGYLQNNAFLQFGTMALDSWLTLGYATSSHMGILKASDPDTSILGGEKNSDGMLIHEHPDAGISLILADGLVEAGSLAGSFELRALSSNEESVFGKFTSDSAFYSTTAMINNYQGISGPSENNTILLAQLTTTGELQYRLNLIVQSESFISPANPEGVVRFVADQDTLISDPETAHFERYSNLLSYPAQCGCTDPYFAEYDPSAVCDDGSCKDSIVFGCLDPAACNFDPEANFHVAELCCYGPDRCDNRDISKVCPDYMKSALLMDLYPNPATNYLIIKAASGYPQQVHMELYDAFGQLKKRESLGEVFEAISYELNLSDLESGIYLVGLRSGSEFLTRTLIKQ